jgi:2-amino-4-hydroxy-6-hydroxymethyldihydropteridine diphosphokinase
LGSNLGDRGANLVEAVTALAQCRGIDVNATSAVYETEPVGETDQPPFYNMAVEIETDLAPLELLNAVKSIETQLGRQPTYRWGPRVIDIDLILWGQRQWESEALTLPHREFRSRAFVLQPLAEIASDAVDPVTGMTVAELAQLAGGRVSKV